MDRGRERRVGLGSAGRRLVDEVVLYVWPIVLGGQNPALSSEARVDLQLADHHRFDNGVVRLRYLVR